MSSFVSRGFRGRRSEPEAEGRLPPGQYLTRDFPVLSAGPTPRTSTDTWDLQLDEGGTLLGRWSWVELLQLPREEITVDIHCVTKWSKLDTSWEGVSLDTLMEGTDSLASYLVAHSDGGYTTNLPLEDVTGGKAWIAFG